MAALRESFEEIMDWVTSCNVIDHRIPEREELFEQLTVLKRRLQALAKTHSSSCGRLSLKALGQELR